MTPGLRAIAVLLAAVLAVQAADAAARHVALPSIQDAIVIPDGSPLAFSAFDKDSITVHFTGRIELSGTYFYGTQAIDDGSGTMSVYFRPDRASTARLPAFRDHGRPDDIFVTNPADFVHAVRPRARVRPGTSTPYASGRITIVVDRFEASIECDAPSFTARFVKVVTPAPLRMAQMPDTGC